MPFHINNINASSHHHNNCMSNYSSLPALKVCAIFLLFVCCPHISRFSAITARHHPITTTIARPIFAATTTTRRRRHHRKKFGFNHSSLPALKVCAIFMLVACCPHLSHFAAITARRHPITTTIARPITALFPHSRFVPFLCFSFSALAYHSVAINYSCSGTVR